jgi:hypothetical protein
METAETTVDTTKDACAVSMSPPAPCSAPTADALLERAHDMLARAHVMLDGWQQAIDWHHDYERYKAQNNGFTGKSAR